MPFRSLEQDERCSEERGGGRRGKKSVLIRDILGDKLFRTIRVGVNPTSSSAATPPVGLPPPLRIAPSARLLLGAPPRPPPGHPALGAVPGPGRRLSRPARTPDLGGSPDPRQPRRRYRAGRRRRRRPEEPRRPRGWSSAARAFAEPGALLPHLIHASG